MQVLKDRIIFNHEDWLNGLADSSDAAIMNGNRSLTSFNPFRIVGIASPGFAATAVTNDAAVTGMIVGGVIKSTTSGSPTATLIGNNGLVHELTVQTTTITNGGGTFPHTIAGTNPVGEDVITYRVGAVKYHFYSHRNDAAWDIGRYDLATTFADTYMSVTAATPLASPYLAGGLGSPHPMIVGADDILYVGDRNFVHGFDGQTGANGTFLAAVWTLPAGYVVTSFAKNAEYLVVFAYKIDETNTAGNVAGQSTAFFFAYDSVDPFKVVELDDNLVSCGFSWKGSVGCFTTGRPSQLWNTGSSKPSDIRVFNGIEFASLKSFNQAPPIHRGVEISSEGIYFNAAGNLYFWGHRKKGDRDALYNMGATGTTSGFLKLLDNARMFISAANSLKYIDNTTFTSASIITHYAAPEFPQGFYGKVKSIEMDLYTLGDASAGAISFTITHLGGTTSSTLISSSTPLYTKYKNKFTLSYTGGVLPEFTMLGIELDWDASTATKVPAQVKSITVFYEAVAFTP